MAKFRKVVGRALVREGKGILKGVARGLIEIATLGLCRPGKSRPYPKRRK